MTDVAGHHQATRPLEGDAGFAGVAVCICAWPRLADAVLAEA
jgi:hypothetical protein